MTFSQEEVRPPGSFVLRPYQEECVTRVLAVYQDRPRCGRALVVLPTGGGKTVIFAEIARRLGVTTLVIAHREELLRQAAEKFHLLAPTLLVGQVGGGQHNWGAPITVASIQTISRAEHLETLHRFAYQLVVIDECHHGAAASYQAVLHALPEAFVLGVTATPERLDGGDITSIFGPPIFWLSILEMVTQSYLCDIRTIAVKTTTSLDGLHTRAGDFDQDELEQLVDTPQRNRRVVEAYLEHASGRQALCFAVMVEHARHLAESFCSAGVSASVVCGETPAEERRAILLAYEQGEIRVLCNVGVLTEGYDAPVTSCIIMARPTQSRGLFLQCLGRGLRLAPGKQDCLVLDITDNCIKHRPPMTVRAALKTAIDDGKSLLETVLRADAADEVEQAHRARQPRRLHADFRPRDMELDLLGRRFWRSQTDGTHRLHLGPHIIRLVPLEREPGNYTILVRLHPDPREQCWLKSAPLDLAREYAEKQAHLLVSGPKKRILVDMQAQWRNLPASSRQLNALRTLLIPHTREITRGEASDLLHQSMTMNKWRRDQQDA